MPVNDHPIHRHLLTRPYQHHVTSDDLLDGDLNRLAAAFHPGGTRL